MKSHGHVMFRIFVLAGLVLASGGCGDGNGGSGRSDGVSSAAESLSIAASVNAVREAFNGGLIALEYDEARDDSSELVVLIGENHASASAQKQLAELLDGMLEKALVDAVLIEGSNGPVDPAVLEDELPSASAETSDFWRRQLEWGLISGYEHAALTHPDIPVHGVEDMAAKGTYAVSQTQGLSKQNLALSLGLLRGGRDALSGVLAELSPTVEARALEQSSAVVNRLDETLDDLEQKGRSLAAAQEPITKLQIEQIRLSHDAQARLQGIGTDTLDRISKLGNEGRKLQTEYESEVKEYKAQLLRLRSMANGRFGSPAFGNILEKQSEQQLAEMLREIERKEARLKRIGKQLEDFDRRHGAEYRKVTSAYERLQEISEQVDELTPALEKPARKYADVHESANDLYFAAANRIRDIAEKRFGPTLSEAPSQFVEDLRAIDTFFKDETKRLRDEHNEQARERLLERDRAMAGNTKSYMASTGRRRVALIVGYAHLPGMAEQLRKRGLAFLGGGLTENETTEPWAIAAWNKRRNGATAVFSSAANIKEPTLLLDEVWTKEMAATVEALRKLRLPDVEPSLRTNAGSVYESVGAKADRVLHVGNYLFDQRIELGPQVVARGPVPGRSSEAFEVWDRGISRELVTAMSDSKAQFVFSYKSASQTGKPEYSFVTSDGVEQSLAQFMKSPPRGSGGTDPDYVVLFAEPDTVVENGVPMSPRWRALRGAGGGTEPPPPAKNGSNGGRGKPPPKWTSGFYDEPGGGGRKRIGLFQTHNPSRARKNIAALRKQKPIEPGEVAFAEDPKSLLDFRFTPSNGDHAGVVVLLARNTGEFRAAVTEASEARKLTNKQVVLITCGDAFKETAELRERILEGGAVMVWTPHRQLSIEGGRRLKGEVQQLIEGSADGGQRFGDMAQVMNEAIFRLEERLPGDGEVLRMRDSSPYVLLLPPEAERTAGGA